MSACSWVLSPIAYCGRVNISRELARFAHFGSRHQLKCSAGRQRAERQEREREQGEVVPGSG